MIEHMQQYNPTGMPENYGYAVQTGINMIADADRKSLYAVADLGLAGKTIFAMGFLGTMQQEIRDGYEPMVCGTEYCSPWADFPLDARGIAVAAGAYAVTSIASRIRNKERTRDMVMTNLEAAINGDLIPYSPATMHARRLMRWTGAKAITGAAIYGGYKLGEELTVGESLATGFGLLALGAIRAASYSISKRLKSRKSNRQDSDSSSRNFIDANESMTRLFANNELT